MTFDGLLTALGMIICITAANTENMTALVILAPLGLGLMFWGIR